MFIWSLDEYCIIYLDFCYCVHCFGLSRADSGHQLILLGLVDGTVLLKSHLGYSKFGRDVPTNGMGVATFRSEAQLLCDLVSCSDIYAIYIRRHTIEYILGSLNFMMAAELVWQP
jgi:hypothetical protein